MEAFQSKFEYQPLMGSGAIRLIELQPSEDPASTLECTLLHTTLRELDEELIYHYCALSYVWGDSENTRPIEVNGKVFHVTCNLASALRHLRHAVRPRFLWADAICINQINNKERSAQVSQMGEVYRSAQHTIIWLGEATQETEKVFHLLRQVIKLTRAEGRLRSLDKHYSSGYSSSEDTSHLTPPTKINALLEKLGTGIEVLLDLPWFTRVWIYQELVFSPDAWLQCGDTRARWEDVSNIINIIPYSGSGSESYERFLAMDKAKRGFSRGLSSLTRPRALFDVLIARRGLGVFDPRDMVFAHLGIVANSRQDQDSFMRKKWKLLKADYAKNTSELYRNVATYLSGNIEIFELLSHVEAASGERLPNTPSWAPNWMDKPFPLPYTKLEERINFLRRTYEKRRHTTLEDRLNENMGSLLLKTIPPSYTIWLSPLVVSFLGFQMGSIIGITEIIFQYNEHWNFDEVPDEYEAQVAFYKPIRDRWWKTFAPLVEQEEKFDTLFWVAFRKFILLKDKCLSDTAHLTNDDILIHLFLNEAQSHGSLLSEIFHGRRLAMISGHRYAVVPGTARIGDVACFFLEKTTIPFILRPVSQPQGSGELEKPILDTFRPRNPSITLVTNHYDFVGECAMENFIFESFDSRWFASGRSEDHPGMLELFILH